MQFSVEVLDLVKRTLPVVSAAAQFASKVVRPEETASSTVSGSESTESACAYSDTSLMHYATVETEHPYKQAAVSHFRVSSGRREGGGREGGVHYATKFQTEERTISW